MFFKHGYKIVDQNDRSFSTGAWGAEVDYKRNMLVGPRAGCGPLAVFNTLENVKEFLDRFGWMPAMVRVYECTYVASEDTFLWKKNIPYNGFQDLPPGTRFASLVSLNRRLFYVKDQGYVSENYLVIA